MCWFHLQWTLFWTHLNLHRRPSVITCSQSLVFCVIGHLNKAPDRFVPGWRFCPNGAPTRSLQVDGNRTRYLVNTIGNNLRFRVEREKKSAENKRERNKTPAMSTRVFSLGVHEIGVAITHREHRWYRVESNQNAPSFYWPYPTCWDFSKACVHRYIVSVENRNAAHIAKLIHDNIFKLNTFGGRATGGRGWSFI